jgi:hypothetical protein
VDADRRHETPGSEKKGFITHSTASSKSISICVSVPFALISHKDADGGPRWMLVQTVGCISGEGSGILEPQIFYNSKCAYSFLQSEALSFTSKGFCLIKALKQIIQNKEQFSIQ